MKCIQLVENLSIAFDCNLSFDEEINQAAKISGYHLGNIAFVKKYLNEQTITMLLHRYAISRLDYYNSICYNLRSYLLETIYKLLLIEQGD